MTDEAGAVSGIKPFVSIEQEEEKDNDDGGGQYDIAKILLLSFVLKEAVEQELIEMISTSEKDLLVSLFAKLV